MKAFLKNYGSTLALLCGIFIGGACGVIFGEGAHVVKPVGDIFLNLIFVMIVPLVFFSIATAVCKMRESHMLGRVLLNVLLVFLGMSLIAALLAYAGVLVFNPLKGTDSAIFLNGLSQSEASGEATLADSIVGTLTVPDFGILLSKSHLLALIIFAALFGYAVSAAGEKGRPMADFIGSGSDVMVRMMSLVMRLAPIGLGCYFADTIASIGDKLLGGYLRVFILYMVMTVVFFFVINSIYVIMAWGRKGLGEYWRHIWTPAITAIATSSSSATMPASIEAAKKMGTTPEIADAVIPLGTNLHKDGSVICAVFKIVFLLMLTSRGIDGPGMMLTIIFVGILESMVQGAVPNGGLTGEIFICSVMGFSPDLVGVIVVIGAIADIPATLLNANSNIVGAILVDRLSGERNS